MDVIGAVGRLHDSLTRRKTKQEGKKKPPLKKEEPAARPQAPSARSSADSGTQIGNLIDTSA
jgi:hypothetical protein